MDLAELTELTTKLLKESKEGGELTDLPCLMCKRPRSQRSDYIRCTPCATNWLAGEDLFKHPHLSREPYLSSAYCRGTSALKVDSDTGA